MNASAALRLVKYLPFAPPAQPFCLAADRHHAVEIRLRQGLVADAVLLEHDDRHDAALRERRAHKEQKRAGREHAAETGGTHGDFLSQIGDLESIRRWRNSPQVGRSTASPQNESLPEFDVSTAS